MKKLFSLLLAISAVALLSSASFAATSGNFGVSASFGNGASIMLYADNDTTIEMSDLTINTAGITFPSEVVGPDIYVGYGVGKVYVKVSGSGTGWSIITYTTNPATDADNDTPACVTTGLMHVVEKTNHVLLKYLKSVNNAPTPYAIGDVLSDAEFQAATWFVNIPYFPSAAEITGGETAIMRNTYGDIPAGTQGYMQWLTATGSSITQKAEFSLILGLTNDLDTPGEYSTTVNFEVLSN